MTNLYGFPRKITRACCWRDQDAPTELYLDVEAELDHLGDVWLYYQYKRSSNGDVYFSAATLEGLQEFLDDPNFIYVEKEDAP